MGSKAVFAGNLTFTSLGHLFQILGDNQSTGVLRLTSQYMPTPGLIHFADGNPINATSGSLNGMEAIYALFGWTEGNFEFHQEKVQVKRVISNSRMSIILDAARMLDEGVIKKVGPGAHDQASQAQSGDSKHARSAALQVAKGPLADYRYVINEEGFRDGQQIVQEGGFGGWLWVILEGTVKVTRNTPNGPLTMLKLGEGSYIGSLSSFTFSSRARDTTSTAEGKVELGVLDIERLSREHASLSSDFKALLLSLDGRLKKTMDAVVELSVKKKRSGGLTGAEKVISIRSSSTAEVFSIVQGEAHVLQQTAKGHLPLLTLEKGDFFGNLLFIDMGHEPNYAKVLASDDLGVAKVNAQRIQEQYDQLSRTFKSMVDNVATCVSLTTRLACNLKEGKGIA